MTPLEERCAALEEENRQLQRKLSEQEQTAAALQSQLQLHEQIVAGSQEGVVVFDSDLRYRVWSPFMERWSGVPADQVLGKRPLDLFPFMRDSGLIHALEEVLRGGPGGQFEFAIPAPGTSELLWTADTISPLRNAAGGVAGAIVLVRDITKRKRAEEALHDQVHFLQQLLDAIPAPIFYKDVHGVYRGCNVAFQEYCGLAKEQIVGRTVFDVAPPDLAPVYRQADEKLLQSETQQVYEASVARGDGTRHDVVFHKAVYRGPGGSPAGLVGVILDITDRKRAEEALRESERRMADIIDFLPDATFAIDREGKVIAWNRAMETMTGVGAKDMLGKGNYEYALPFYGVRRPIMVDLVLQPNQDMEKRYDPIIAQQKDMLIAETWVTWLAEAAARSGERPAPCTTSRETWWGQLRPSLTSRTARRPRRRYGRARNATGTSSNPRGTSSGKRTRISSARM